MQSDSSLNLLLAATSLSGDRSFLASRLESLTVLVDTQDAKQLANTGTRRVMTMRIPRKTQSLRVVVQTSDNERTGAVELDRKTIDSAPEAPTPEPKLLPQPRKQPVPVTPLRH